MARYYDVTFRKPDEDEITIRGYGNTRRSAERSARAKMARSGLYGLVTLSVDFVRSGEGGGGYG